ncbi:NUDIX domain-containing protein [Agromyces sp. SYSU T0242]|uniref:NUDIX domain-containing protein n=1 Tax=Agromyces litoreus TaxID=3158561 RepID=UPI003390F3E9
MPVTSAGLLLYRRAPGLEVFLAHMGGPYWSGRHEHAWSMPKGLVEPGEDERDAAFREFAEEVGADAPLGPGDAVDLGSVRASSSKVLRVFAAEAEGFAPEFRPGTFELEWPPRSGRTAEFPEVDEVRWVPVDEARTLLVKGQVAALERLERHLAGSRDETGG